MNDSGKPKKTKSILKKAQTLIGNVGSFFALTNWIAST